MASPASIPLPSEEGLEEGKVNGYDIFRFDIFRFDIGEVIGIIPTFSDRI